MSFMKMPCARCPWRKDIEPGEFPVERYIALAPIAYDGSMVQFACHKGACGKEVACAGFLLKNSMHNIGVRLSWRRGVFGPTAEQISDVVSDGGYELHASFRAMAIYQGVPADHPALERCRADDE